MRQIAFLFKPDFCRHKSIYFPCIIVDNEKEELSYEELSEEERASLEPMIKQTLLACDLKTCTAKRYEQT